MQIATLVIDNHDSLTAPAIAYAGEDRAALEAFGELTSTSVTRRLDHKEASSLAALTSELADLGDGNDVALLYVAAHGVSRGGVPYLLCTDYDPSEYSEPSSPARGQYPLAELLKSYEKCPAKTRILVLDTGRLETDVAGGMLVNEFPRLVEAELKKPGVSENLWVILANSFCERSLVSRADRRSAFSYFFCQALRGQADTDGDGDKKVELNEVAAYLERVSKWAAAATGQTGSQTPARAAGWSGSCQTAS